MKKLTFILICVIFLLVACSKATTGTWTEHTILEKSPLKTSAYVYDTNKEGKGIVIIGGIHGNETAGFKAAAILKDELETLITNGSVLIIPNANSLAINNDRRYAEGYSDLNRAFLNDGDSEETNKLAIAIKSMIIDFDPVLIIDHHESLDNYKNKRLGNTIIVSDVGDNLLNSLFILDKINEKIEDDLPFILESTPPSGSLNKTLSNELSIMVITIETNRKLALEKRVDQQLIVAKEILNSLIEE